MSSETPFVRDDVKALLAMIEQMGSPSMEEGTPAEAREAYLAMAQLAEADPRELAVIRDLSCPGPAGDIPLRLYDARENREAGPLMMFYHGGGFVVGDLDSHHSFCTELAAELDIPVLAVDYRLGPEAPFPAATDDCEAATRWAASSPDALGRQVTGLIPIGDSAGGNLTIVTSNALNASPADVPIVMQVPIYPVAGDISAHQSAADFAEGYMLTASLMGWFEGNYGGDPADLRKSPILAVTPVIPPTVLCTCSLDPLRDSGREYAAKAIAAGSDVTYLEFQGNIHGFINSRKALPSGHQDALKLIAAIKNMMERIA